MKLLFDQNLSHKLARRLGDFAPGSAHVRDAGLSRASDGEIWEFALREGFAIVTKDSDFPERALVEERFPKVVWIQVGNCSTREIADLLRERAPDFERLESEPELRLLVIR